MWRGEGDGMEGGGGMTQTTLYYLAEDLAVKGCSDTDHSLLLG